MKSNNENSDTNYLVIRRHSKVTAVIVFALMITVNPLLSSFQSIEKVFASLFFNPSDYGFPINDSEWIDSYANLSYQVEKSVEGSLGNVYRNEIGLYELEPLYGSQLTTGAVYGQQRLQELNMILHCKLIETRDNYVQELEQLNKGRGELVSNTGSGQLSSSSSNNDTNVMDEKIAFGKTKECHARDTAGKNNVTRLLNDANFLN
jgi:hypothetical protein